MIIGVLKEIKNNENRVAATPECVREFVSHGHRVLIEENAGTGSCIEDHRFEAAGAEIIADKYRICREANLILKVKEPVPEEYTLFSPGQILFTFFHFASSRRLTRAMLDANVICIAYETVRAPDGNFPLLAPMSEIAGKMASIVGAYYLARPLGGKGILASPAAGVNAARYTIVGSGNVGKAAAAVALGMEADVVILTETQRQKDEIRRLFPRASAEVAETEQIVSCLSDTDVLIGGVYVAGDRAPRLITRRMVRQMEPGSVIIDVSIDQGGCVETSRPTSHSHPVYMEEGILHYCVTNMPGVFPQTSTYALTRVVRPYALKIADSGEKALEDPALLKGLNIYRGRLTNPKVAAVFELPYATFP